MQDSIATPQGLEESASDTGLSNKSRPGTTKDTTQNFVDAPKDAQLAELVSIWERLSASDRQTLFDHAQSFLPVTDRNR